MDGKLLVLKKIMSTVTLTTHHSAMTIAWFRIAFQYGKVTEELVDVLSTYFPNKRTFDLSVPMLKTLGIKSLDEDEQIILQNSFKIKGKRNKTETEKELSKNRVRIMNKINRTISRMRKELFPEALEMSDTSLENDEVLL